MSGELTTSEVLAGKKSESVLGRGLADLKATSESANNIFLKPTQKSLSELKIEIKFHLGQMAGHAVEIGKLLIQAKEQVQHGEWQNWLEDNFNLKRQSAQNFMKIAERFGANYQSIGNLNYTQMVNLLALPEGEEENFIAERAEDGTPVEEMTIKILREEIKNYKAKLVDVTEERDNYKISSDIASKQIKELGTEIAELKEKPIEVAVEYPADYESTKAELAELKENLRQEQSETDKKVVALFELLPFLSAIDYNELNKAIENYANTNPSVIKTLVQKYNKVQLRLNNIFKTSRF